MSAYKAVPVLLAFLSFGLAAPARASTITVQPSGDYGAQADGGGGPFLATTTDHGQFLTFCLELNEHFAYGETYEYTISDIDTTTTGDQLSFASKWLYAQLLNGAYKGIAEFGFDAGAAGAHVQEAIWFLEGELTAGEMATRPLSLTLAELALNKEGDWDLLQASGHYTVGVVNMGPYQDLMYGKFDADPASVPEPASLMLFGTGLAMVARRFRKNSR